ncbi:MAG: stage V sporulation protein AA [Defluviitaleaceae bacterium]|nr:stage V sporulation protein AA [Defluviitaleaceae bacterium]
MTEIYVKPKKKAAIVGQKYVTVKDIADVFAADNIQKRAENVHLLATGGKDGVHLVSIIDIVKAISAALPEHSIINVGETDTMVSVKAIPPKKRKITRWLKVALVSLILFTGATTAIMTFHTDSQMGTVFQRYHKIFFGEEAEHPYIINIPYSIGLAVGIVVFFNHFTGKRITKQPTPIEVEMATYEKDVEDAVIDSLSLQKEKEK